MRHTRRVPAIPALTISVTMAACFSFAATSLAQGSDSQTVSDVKKLLTKIADYDFGDSHQLLATLRVLIQSSLDSQDSKGQVEQGLISYLESDATFPENDLSPNRKAKNVAETDRCVSGFLATDGICSFSVGEKAERIR